MKANKFRVLLVEEDVDLGTAVKDLLTRSGFDCHLLLQPASGTALFKKQKPHLVLLSLGLPNIGGAALCAPIRALSSVPIVVLSVRTRREDHLHALNLGADEFIMVRPLDEQLTMARILALMRRVYRYPHPELKESLDTQVAEKPLGQLPSGWATCDSCGYMGPQNRFDRLNAQGERALLCPHCDRSQNLVYTVG